MRWPWSRKEQRSSGGDYSDRILRLYEADAAGTAADHGATAAVEAASGALSRAFASARVEGPPYVRQAVTAGVLAQIGRDVLRRGQSMHLIRVSEMGRVSLVPCADWDFRGGDDRESWRLQVTSYGPDTSTTRYPSFDGVVFLTWGSAPGTPYVGRGPLAWASQTARLSAEADRSLADEAAGPIANLLTVPQDGGDGEDGDPLKMLKADLRTARGRALLLETTAAGFGDGRSAAPQRDWVPSRLGPDPPAGLVQVREQAFNAVLASTGTPPSLFLDSDGTSQREAVRRWHMNLVLPMARLLEEELSAKLEADVRLVFDNYPLDLAGRAQAFQKLVAGGLSPVEALATSGLLADA